MGYGDELIGSGIARGAKARGKRIAFGDGQKIRWHPYAEKIYRNNPNVAPPGQEGAADLEWVAHYVGNRVYNRFDGTRWKWVTGFNNRPGEIFFDDGDLSFAKKQGAGFIIVEPNVPVFKSVAVNKQWPVGRYDEVARHLMAQGREVVQFIYGPPHGPGHRLPGVRQIKAPDFRHALAVLARASLYVGPEGGLHHGAAASPIGIPAVVIFGGMISPDITGYASHTNIFTGGEACGSLTPCEHCRKALDAITVDQVCAAAMDRLKAFAA